MSGSTVDGPAVRLRGVTKRFGDMPAVLGLDLDIPRGTVMGLLGPNGSGKTTTIRMIMGILLPDEGSVRVLGGAPGRGNRAALGYLPEERGVYKGMRVVDLLVFLGEIRGLRRSVARLRALDWMDRLGLADRAFNKVEELSKGMQQKVQFIGTVLHLPELLILDEPFSGLDPLNQDVLEQIVKEFRERGTTILLSTHLMDQAERLCERVCLISGARRVLEGNLGEIKRRERKGVLALEFEGGEDWVGGPEVTGVEQRSGGVHVLLREGADGEAVLRRGLAAGVSIRRFELLEPSLREIFVRHAGGEEQGPHLHDEENPVSGTGGQRKAGGPP